MNDLTTIGIVALVLGFLVLLVAAGFWRLVVALVAAALIAAGTAAGVGWVTWRVASSVITGGGEWRGLGPLVVGVIATGVVFLVVFVVTLIVIGVTKRGIFRRSPASRVALGVSALLFAGGMGAFVLDTPEHASTTRLVRRLGDGGASPRTSRSWCDAAPPPCRCCSPNCTGIRIRATTISLRARCRRCCTSSGSLVARTPTRNCTAGWTPTWMRASGSPP